ncbi:amino acid adenylation domain-containing protein, partial [Methylobacterium aquaticum]|uniref:amino acid adenylation domain-containing protein n=1 Tax=Methylobacterium aquaticum TaxID=270351 RepID=UPI003D179E32
MRNDTLVDRLRRHAALRPETPAVRFLAGDALVADLTYATLDARIRAVAAHLQAQAAPGERAVLLLPSGIDYVVAFYACLYAGLVAVPAYPPEGGGARHADRLGGILADAEPRLVLTSEVLRGTVAAALPPDRQPLLLAVDAVPDEAAAEWRETSPAPDSLAFLQYTSGSTSRPKGVRVTHANLEANETAITASFRMSREDVFVSWLPLYHDMGLIGGLMQPLHLGIPTVLMAPRSFIERPRRWLDAVARFGGTVSGGPDFAYALCAERIGAEAAAEIDLRRWRLAFSGAEFVRPATLERFARRFAASGFAPAAFLPCYGLAEATLLVTASVPGAGATTGRFEPGALALGRAVPAEGEDKGAWARHVGVGHAVRDHAVRIMRADGAGPAEAGTLGEIWVCGPSVADGYWRNPEATAAAFVREGDERWLRTGDLGFVRDGALTVTGRIKDMLIVRGENLFPQDIEQAVEAAVEAVRPGRVAAFPVEIDGREGIGVAAEFARGVARLVPAKALHDAVAGAIARLCGEAPAVVVLLNPRGMPLTTSGKLQRSACAALWDREGGLDSLAVFVAGEARGSAPPLSGEGPLSATEALVAEIWRDVLGGALPVGADDFFLRGGNSIAAGQAAAILRERHGIEVEPGAFFAHPTLRAFAAHLDARPPAARPMIPPVVPAARGAASPLSHAQSRLWFLWQLDPASTAYTVAASIRLSGPLDADKLLWALAAVAGRHESLRTTFEAREDGAVQIVHPTMPVPVRREDLSRVEPGRREATRDGLVRDALDAPFDLTQGPLVRACLVRLGETSHDLVLTAHHIVVDGASMEVLLSELAQLYRGLEPAPLPVQYADYAAWQRAWLASGEGERQLAYWRAALGADQPVLALPHDRPRPAAQSHRGDSVGLTIEPALAERLRALAARERASIAMVLFTAYGLLLHRHSGQDDIRIGVPTANRRLRAIEGLIGFFVNTLVLRATFDPRDSFAALVGRTRETLAAALAHQDLPFERLVEVLQPERSLAHNPLFQAKFNSMAELRGFEAVAGLDATVEIIDLAGSHFDLALDVVDGPRGMRATFNYATDLFDRDTIDRLAAGFGDLLRQVAEAPERILSGLALGAGQALPVEAAAYPDPTVPALFRRAVARDPDAIAVTDSAGDLSYAALDARSDRLASALRARGLRPETPVALLAERSVAFVVGVLAAMKAGLAAVPLDPAWPEGRLRALLDGAGIDLVLSAGEALGLAGRTNRDLIDLDREPPDTDAALPPLHPDQIAYVIYTSGSTGRPKGVAVPHGALANYVQAVLSRLAPDGASPAGGSLAGCSMAMVSTVAADLGHTVLFGALASGAHLHLVPRDDAFDAERFAARMRGAEVDILKIVPSHLSGLLQAESSGAVLPRRVLVLGGEALDPALVAEIRRLRPGLRIVNHYGPTETAVGALTQEIGQEVGQEVGPENKAPPIGRPLANLSAHILDGALSPVPAGVTGELFIGGAGLARGYRGAPGLTAERFVPDPSGPPGARLYRTGDRVRADRDGRAHFLGRADDQIKLRGYRIEPGEIARALLARDDVREAVVLAQPVPPDGARRQLVAYLTAAPERRPDGSAVKADLAGILPEVMVPAHIVVVERLPLTPNGKIDRNALPVPDATAAARSEVPEGPVEQAMAEVWAQVLRRESVGVTDNFFELGGDSILSLQVIARLRKRGIKLTPKQIFDRQTIRSLAAVAGTIPVKGAPAAAGPAAEAPAGAIPLLPIQDRFFADVTEERHHWNQALLLIPRDRLDPEVLHRALRAVVARHEALRLRFVEGPSGWSAARGPDEAGPDLLRTDSAAGAEALTALCTDVQTGLDPAAGRLIRALLVAYPDGGQRLLIAIHHLAVDGVSWRILLDDLATAYAQAERDEVIALGTPTDGIAAWAAALHARTAGGGLNAELPFWLGQGDGEAAPTGRGQEAPGWAQKAPGCLGESDTLHTRLPAGLTARLLAEAPATYRTQVNDLLLAALLRALGRWSGRDSALIELEGHGREDIVPGIDLSRTVGWFTTAFPLRLDGAGLGTRDLIRSVKERLRAVPNRGLGYGWLARFGTAAQRDALAGLPAPDIVFNYLGQFEDSLGAGAPFARAPEDPGPSRSAKAPLTRPLAIDGEVRDGCLHLSWRYGRRQHDRAAIEALAATYAEALEEVVAHCTGADAALTPSDVPVSGLDQASLDALLTAAALDPRTIEDIYPLSPVQQGILFHALADEASRGTYVNQIAVTVTGLDPARLDTAWAAATRRHAILRTSIHWRGIDGPGLQVVHRDGPFAVLREDGPGIDPVAAERAEREAGFALDTVPLQRVRLIRLDDAPDGRSRHRLIWTSHHILMDGWSSARLLAEVLGGVSEPAPGRYRDFIAWLGTRDLAAAEAFWRQQLAALDEPTLLAEAFGRRNPEDGVGTVRTALAGDALARLRAFAGAERVTLNTLVQGAVALLLTRLTGQASVAFGVTVAGRPAELASAETTLGLFINTLPVVERAAPEAPVGPWLRSLQDRNLALREHEHTPLGAIQRWAGRPGQPLFDVLLVFENYPVDAVLSGAAFSDLSHLNLTNYPLTLSIFATAERLEIRIDHDRASFSDAQAAQLAGLLAGLVGALAEDAESRLGAIPMPADGVADALSAPAPMAGTETVTAAFARQVRERPDAEALRWGDTRLSYADLDARATHLARHLGARGIGPGAL